MSNKYSYIDIHGHLNFDKYDVDRNEVIQRANNAKVAMITVGTDIASSLSAVELASINQNMWATVGIHPTEADQPIDFDELESLAKHPKVVAIGECGLDYFHSKLGDIEKQKEVFIKHIELANKVGKPLMLHVRNGLSKSSHRTDNLKGIEGNAYQQALEILKKYSKVKANFHFFAGTIQDLKDIVDMNYSVSFTGVTTFTKDYDELIKQVPITNIMSETDCPFVAPVPHRGKRNEPSFVMEVVKAIAKVKGIDENVLAKQLVSNAQKFFDLR